MKEAKTFTQELHTGPYRSFIFVNKSQIGIVLDFYDSVLQQAL